MFQLWDKSALKGCVLSLVMRVSFKMDSLNLTALKVKVHRYSLHSGQLAVYNFTPGLMTHSYMPHLNGENTRTR